MNMETDKWLLLSKRLLCHCTPSNFLHRLSWRFWPIDPKRLKIMVMLTESLQRVFVWPREVWGKRTRKYTWRKKTGTTRLRPVGRAKRAQSPTKPSLERSLTPISVSDFFSYFWTNFKSCGKKKTKKKLHISDIGFAFNISAACFSDVHGCKNRNFYKVRKNTLLGKGCLMWKKKRRQRGRGLM